MSKGTRVAVGVGLIALGVAIGLGAGLVTGAAMQPDIHPTYLIQTPEPTPTVGNPNTPGLDNSDHDWTIAPCSLWANTEYPVLPPYTIQDACAFKDTDGKWKIDYAVHGRPDTGGDDTDLGQLPTL